MPKPVKILQASAGSGKTFSLTTHYLTLLFSSETKYREILAVTFTNKATEEMKTRILEVLIGLAKGNTSKKIDDYRKLILAAYPNLTPEELKQKADKIYRKILHDYSRFSVSTIDGFVQKVIRGFAFELNLNADYTLEMNIDKVKNDLVDKLDESLNDKPQLLQWIIDLALERINNNKSWDYKSELFQLTSEIFSERFQIFGQAVAEIGEENLDSLFAQYIQNTKTEIKNFEDEIIRLVKDTQEVMDVYGVETDQLKGKSRSPLNKLKIISKDDITKIEDVFKLVDEPEEWFQKNVSGAEIYESINPILKAIQHHYEQFSPRYQLAVAFNKNLYYLRLMQEIANLLKEYRVENGNLLISDAQKLITGITDDAGENPSFIWEKVGNRYRNFLFDEFQDTSTSQWSSFKSLLTNAIATPSEDLIDHLIVGDTKQAIYRWRNGDWNILHQKAREDVGEHNVLDDSLAENYRSTENIIVFNNFLYQSIPRALQTELNKNVSQIGGNILSWWQSKRYDEIIPSIYAGASQNLAATTKKGGTIKIKRFGADDTPEENRFTETAFREIALQEVIEEIHRLRNEQQYALKDIAILVRSNTEAALVVERLMEENLPVLSGDALLISKNSAIQLIINTLKVLVGVDLQSALYKANCISLYHKLQKKVTAASDFTHLSSTTLSNLSAVLPPDLCLQWQSWLQLPLAELIENLIDAYGLKEQIQHLPYLLAFRDLTANATRMGEKGIIAFLSWWDEDGIKKSLPSPESADAVQIITIHKSKGLAFAAVFIPFCNWEIKGKPGSNFWVSTENTLYQALKSIPLRYDEKLAKSVVAEAYYEELLYNNIDALNMLYVATTRSKNYLYIATMAKKEFKLSNMGDVLNFALDTQFDENGLYEIIDFTPENSKPKEENVFQLASYPTTTRLSELYVPTEDKHLLHLLNMQKSARDGSILHDILANATTEQQAKDYIANLVLQGVLKLDEQQSFYDSAVKTLNHPELKAILESPSKNIIEKTIIDENGKPYRPDRVVMLNEEVIILDYKFTFEESVQHDKQLNTYKSLFAEMGYQNIKTYLFYAETGKLKLV
ncbi:UvrD-helicase domain-containing protein [Pedobacter sp. MW01-1-1]|uniref:UvrD-helicase domain-containing protein n=1 Tax=Pedobacter sp. MW01-1-1 TaxID=3383027 RepID=UPI003FEF9159